MAIKCMEPELQLGLSELGPALLVLLVFNCLARVCQLPFRCCKGCSCLHKRTHLFPDLQSAHSTLLGNVCLLDYKPMHT